VHQEFLEFKEIIVPVPNLWKSFTELYSETDEQCVQPYTIYT